MAHMDYRALSVSEFDGEIIGKGRRTVLNCLHCGKILLETSLLPPGTVIEIKCVTCKNVHYFGPEGARFDDLYDVRCNSCKKMLFRVKNESGMVVVKECTRAGCRTTNRLVFM